MKNNYGVLGFVYTRDSFFSTGIVEVTDEDFKNEDFIPSHVFIVLDGGLIIESLVGEGVQYGSLSKYSGNKYTVRYKRPKYSVIDPIKAVNITRELSNRKYDLKLILGLLFSNTIGRFLPKSFTRYVVSKFDSENRFICSELAVEWSKKVGTFREEETDRVSPVRLYYTSPNLIHEVKSYEQDRTNKASS